MPEKRTSKARDDRRGDDYASIDLAMLIRFAIFARDGEGAAVPLSFRQFMGDSGSHRTMVQTVDAIERLAKRLIVYRSILNEKGRGTGQFTDDYVVVDEEVKTKRVGAITDSGQAWADLGRYLGDLIEVMVEGGDDPAALRLYIAQQADELDRAKQAIRRRGQGR